MKTLVYTVQNSVLNVQGRKFENVEKRQEMYATGLLQVLQLQSQ